MLPMSSTHALLDPLGHLPVLGDNAPVDLLLQTLLVPDGQRLDLGDFLGLFFVILESTKEKYFSSFAHILNGHWEYIDKEVSPRSRAAMSRHPRSRAAIHRLPRSRTVVYHRPRISNFHELWSRELPKAQNLPPPWRRTKMS